MDTRNYDTLVYLIKVTHLKDFKNKLGSVLTQLLGQIRQERGLKSEFPGVWALGKAEERPMLGALL